MALNRKTFKKAAAAVADTNLPSGYFNTVLYEGNGGTQRIGGYINRGAIFNGNGNITTSLDFNSFTDYSISMWVYADANAGFIAGTINSSGTTGLYLQIDTGGNVIFYEVSSGGTAYTVTSTGTITTNDWNHIALVRDSSTNYVYINNGSPDSASNASITHATGLTLGRAGAFTAAGIYTGKLDQVRIFDKALSSSEVTTLYGETHASATIETTDIFNDNSGVALYQLDGNANDTGGASGKFGSAAIFNGSSSLITLPSTLRNVFDSSTRSISFWFNSANTSPLQAILRHDHSSDSHGRTTVLLDSNTITVLVGDSGSYPLSGTINNNQWYHLAVSVDGSTYTAYLNGVSFGSATNNNYSSGDYFIFGANTDGSQYSFNGKLDQVRIYNTALSSSDVTNLYNESSVPTANLVAHYKLDGDARDEQQLYDGAATNVTYAYDGTATNVTYQEATNFSPDLVWIKNRDASYSHMLYDSIRGAGEDLSSDTTNAEGTVTGLMTSFDTNGFTVVASGSNRTNYSGEDYVSWCFNAGTDAAASNTDGSINSTVKANQDAGFSIVKFNGGNTSGTTVGHGLSSAPELIIVKNTSDTASWPVLTQTGYTIGATTFTLSGSSNYLALNSTSGYISYTFDQQLGGTNNGGLASDVLIAYCFHSVDGFQKVGSYTGNGSANGTIVETGFEPAFIMIKATNLDRNWVILDNKRGYGNNLSANTSTEEYLTSNGQGMEVQFLSNGFQIETTSSWINNNTTNYIYLAIAADPDTTTPTVENSFDVVTYTGNGSTQSIDTDFKPDLVWVKSRSNSTSHVLSDSVRGANLKLRSNSTATEAGTDYGVVTSFDTNGFTVGGTIDTGDVNYLNWTYVAWCWKAGDHDDNLPQINTEGTIDSVVSVNDAAGFSIVKYTGNSTAGATVGHGLSSAPDLIIAKGLETASAYNWMVYASAATTSLGKTAEHGHAYLNLTNVYEEPIDQNIKSIWNDTAPTSTVFSISDNVNINANGGYIAYCFTSISGYQEVGSYSGTGATTNKITTGFKPRFLLVKQTNTTRNWYIIDSTRNPSDPRNLLLIPNDSATEFAGSGDVYCDFLSDGFEWTSSAGDAVNQSGGTYIYLAIA